MPATSDICAGGPIGFLAVTPAQALQDARRVILGEHYLFYFSIFALLAALPLLGEGYFLLVRGRRREVQIIAISALASFVGSIVLFVYGVDWGRWIYIHIVSLTILMLFMDARTVQDGTSFSAGTALPTWPKSGLAAILVCYSLCWSLPAVVTKEPIRMGYMGRIHEVLSSRLSR
jgi:hypothetical protein